MCGVSSPSVSAKHTTYTECNESLSLEQRTQCDTKQVALKTL